MFLYEYLFKISDRVITSNLANPLTRGYRVVASKFKEFPAQTHPSTNRDITQTIQSDMTGKHKNVVVIVCQENQCHNRKCDTTPKNVCSSNQTKSTVIRLADALTPKIPAGKEEVYLENHNGARKSLLQYMVKEAGTIPINSFEFKEHERMTEYS